MTFQFRIKVDELPDYNEVGAFPGDTNYDLLVFCDVDLITFEVSDMSLYDFAYSLGVSTKVLTSKDLECLRKLCVAKAEMNVGDILDSQKESADE